MKKIIGLMLTLILVLGGLLTGCSSKDDKATTATAQILVKK